MEETKTVESKNVWEVAYRGRDWIAWYDYRERCFVLECKNADGFKIQIERPENFVTADYIGWFQIALRQIHNLLNNGKCSY